MKKLCELKEVLEAIDNNAPEELKGELIKKVILLAIDRVEYDFLKITMRDNKEELHLNILAVRPETESKTESECTTPCH